MNTKGDELNNLKETLGNEKWLRKNEDSLKKLLLETWTHMHNLNGLKIGFGLKLIGVDWRSDDELSKIMLWLEKVGIMVRQNTYQIKASHRSIFKG